RRAFANALVWTAVVGGAAVLVSLWAYGVPSEGRPRGPLTALLPNLSAGQFAFAALALPGELFFALGLFALLGRRRVVAYGAIRLLRRGILLVAALAAAAIARLSLDVALVLNLVALGAAGLAIAVVAWRDGTAGLLPDAEVLREELAFGS